MWEQTGEKAVCLKAKTEDEIMQLQVTAEKHGIVSYLVEDAGRTQIESESKTVLAIGPDSDERINEITGYLKLY